MTGLLAVIALSPAHAIYKGERAEFSSYEFMVSLRPAAAPDQHLCGGTLIAPEIVLTAAHCIARAKPTKMTVLVGVDKPEWDFAVGVRISGYRVANGFSMRRSNRNDLALLRLAEPQSTPVVALGATEPAVGDRVTMAGWGCTDNPPKCKHHPKSLQEATQRVVSDSRCDRSAFWNPPAHAGASICAGGSSMTSFGDSGGPLLVGDAATGFTQVGLSSLLTDRKRARLNAYTSIAKLRRWVDEASAALLRGGGR
jgi:secreted trypsin-like serine protease